MKINAVEFAQSSHKRLTLLGMSGVGKTHLAKLLNQANARAWYHYSGDYRIGAKYLDKAILDNITQKMRQDNVLADLLKNHSISVQNHISFDNLSSVANFLGKVGNPEKKGLPIDEFIQRQALHRQAEVQAMGDVKKFIEKSKTAGFAHFINDAGGSLCELDDEKLYQMLSEHTLILYIKASEDNQSALIERAQQSPKPLYYQPDFLKAQLEHYLTEHGLTYVAQIDPDAFVRWVFPQLLAHRIPKYEAIARRYGCSIDSKDLYQCTNAEQALELIGEALN